MRRVGGGAAHLWRPFCTRVEAVRRLAQASGADREAVEWAKSLGVEDFDELVQTLSEPTA